MRKKRSERARTSQEGERQTKRSLRGAPSDLPAATEVKLAALDEELGSFETHLLSSGAERAALIEHRIEAVLDSLDRLAASLAEQRGMPAPVRDCARAALEAVRAALRRAARSVSRAKRATITEVLGVWRQRVAEACAELDGELALALTRASRLADHSLKPALGRYSKARKLLDMELRLAAAHVRLFARRRGQPLALRRREITAEVTALRTRLETPRARLADQRARSALEWKELDTALRKDVDEIALALERLLG